MEQNAIKVKIIDVINNKSTIVELRDLQSVPEDIKKIIQIVFTKSQLIFIGNTNSKLSIEMFYNIAKTVHGIVGQSLEWRITDIMPKPMDLSAYLLLRYKNDE